MKRTLFLTVAAVVFTMCGCQDLSRGKRARQAEGEYRTILAWLECEECVDGELEAVTKLGQKAVPSLAASLKDGPSQAKREFYLDHLKDAYRQLREYGITHPESKIAMSERQYVEEYMDNYVSLHRSRAAKALGVIGGADAKKALNEALQADVRDDVRIAVRDSLGGIGRP